MKSRRNSKFLDDVQARQRATIWPDTLRGGRSVDSFLWKGSPDATKIQRVGISSSPSFLLLWPSWVYSLGYAAAFKHNASTSLFMFLFAFFLAAVGCKLLGNAFRH